MAQPTRKKMYRTMQGRLIDIDKLRASNETIQAVGNMHVNARGDVVGQSGRIIKSKDEVMKEYYKAPTGQVDTTPIKKEKAQSIPQKEVVQTKVINPTVQTQPKTEQVNTTTTDLFKPKTPTAEKSGIDAALDGIE